MARKFAELESKMAQTSLERSDAIYRQLLAELPLAELRRARGLSQKTLAGVLHVDQASISKMKRRTDMYISTLRSHIEAMGGELEIVARFPDGTVKITNFNGIESS
ncbi:MAG: XRE family transcriptional regulator [Burkholderiales bacterium]